MASNAGPSAARRPLHGSRRHLVTRSSPWPRPARSGRGSGNRTGDSGTLLLGRLNGGMVPHKSGQPKQRWPSASRRRTAALIVAPPGSVSGSHVMTSPSDVVSGSSPAAMTRVSRSCVVKMPTRHPVLGDQDAAADMLGHGLGGRAHGGIGCRADERLALDKVADATMGHRLLLLVACSAPPRPWKRRLSAAAVAARAG